MNLLYRWLNSQPQKTAPLFDEDDLVVKTFIHNNMRKLRRHSEFDNMIIETVENGLQKKTWQGLIYIMHWKLGNNIVPLYVGKAERKGVKQPISFNISNIRKNHHAFARWGYGLAYHVGDLSHAIFRETAYKKPAKKYEKWATLLFKKSVPPVLKEKVYVTVFSWDNTMKGPSGLVGTVASVEKEIIALAGTFAGSQLLNVDGK